MYICSVIDMMDGIYFGLRIEVEVDTDGFGLS